MRRFVWCFFIIISFIGCSEQVTISPELVLEGWIEDDGHPFVMLHNTYTAQEEPVGNFDEIIEDKVIFWGKVEIFDDDVSDVLTGKLDIEYMPPYYYYSVDIMGKSGRTYEITAEYEGQTVSATTTIPNRVEFDSIKVEILPSGKDVRLTGYFVDEDVEDNYYVLFFRKEGYKQYLNCSLGVLSDKSADENGIIQVPIYNNFSVAYLAKGDEKLSRFFKRDDIIYLKLSAVDRVSYEIWEDISALSATTAIAFLPVYNNIRTNINGGKGYWCGYASSVYSLILDKDTTYIY